MSKEIDIRPPMSVYETFKNYRYRINTAIPEFLDNSIASFRKNWSIIEREENKGKNIEKTIVVIFNRKLNEVIVRDSAFGISEGDFVRALKIKSTPKDATGLNEFGMGLKTAAFWFGKNLEIITNNPFESKGDFRDGAKLKLTSKEIDSGVEKITAKSYNAKDSKWKLHHGTVITISEVYRDMTNAVIKNCAESISRKYRRDILNKGIKIYIYAVEADGKILDINRWMKNGNKGASHVEFSNLYSGLPLSYEKTPIHVNPITSKEVKTNFSFKIEHKGIVYPISGEIFMREKGNRNEAGIDLFRRGRIVVEKFTSFWPEQSSFAYQRINGYLDLDTFPVTQAKDDIDWEGSLFEAVKDRLLSLKDVNEIVKYANNYRKRANNDLGDISKTNKEFRKKAKFILLGKKAKPLTSEETKKIAAKAELNFKDTDYATEIITSNGVKQLYSRLVTNGSLGAWIRISKPENELIFVEIDVNHVFFNPFNDLKENGKFSEKFINILREFSVYWAYAEDESIEMGETADDFRVRLSDLIEKNKEGR